MAKFRRNHEPRGRGNGGMVRLLLLLLLLFTGGVAFLFFQFNRLPVQDEMLFLPEGSRGEISEKNGAAQSLLPDGSMEWRAWEMGADKDQSNRRGWIPPTFPEALLWVWLTHDRELQLVSGHSEGYSYLAILDLRQPEYKSLAFLKNEEKGNWDAVSVDSVEVLTGLDFFATFIEPALQDSLERRIDTFRWSGLAPYLALPNTN